MHPKREKLKYMLGIYLSYLVMCAPFVIKDKLIKMSLVCF